MDTATVTTGVGPTGRPNARRLDPGIAVAVLSGGLVAVAALLFEIADRNPVVTHGSRLPWWTFAIGFAVTELWVVRVEVRHEAHVFAFAEVPLVLALFYAAPGGL